MVLHSGSMEGHYSQLNLLPDMGLGIYVSSRGQEDGSQDVRELASMYIGMTLESICDFWQKQLAMQKVNLSISYRGWPS